MKKLIIYFIVTMFYTTMSVQAHCHHSHNYVTHTNYFQEELHFANCNKHSLLNETTVYYYANGTRNSYTTSTIYNNDGTILESGCYNVRHLIYNNKHYFTFYKNKKYQIIDENANYLSVKNYKYMKEIAPNKLLVKLDKKYGVIDFNEKIIIPIKYKKFEQVEQNLFITQLNGYYGMCNNANNIIIKNENDTIKPLYETYLLKKMGNYGLTDKNGKIILPVEYNKIKKLGEYILIEKNNKFGVLDSTGEIIAKPIYKEIRLNRNILEGKINKGYWINLQQNI